LADRASAADRPLTDDPQPISSATGDRTASHQSPSQQIAAGALKAQRAAAAKPRRHADANALYRDALKNL
jgi:hypothetical protein